jgi:hypothetical protein
MSERSAAGPGADDDDVKVFGHVTTISGAPARRTIPAG